MGARPQPVHATPLAFLATSPKPGCASCTLTQAVVSGKPLIVIYGGKLVGGEKGAIPKCIRKLTADTASGRYSYHRVTEALLLAKYHMMIITYRIVNNALVAVSMVW